MRKLLISFPLLALFLFFVFSTSSLSTTRGIMVTNKLGQTLYLYKDYHALVIGVSNYERWPKLPNAVNDAREVASRLKELGFVVKLVLDPSSGEMKSALNDMVYEVGREKNRALLFYYAGHGATETLADNTKMGYIIPRDCPVLKQDPRSFATHAISMREIESVSLRIRANHVIMLFDSCFSGSMFNLVRAVPDDITEKSTFPVRQYITAGREDEQVPDKSMFKRCFLIGLDGDADLTGDGYITGSELGMYLSDKVVNYTRRGQHPQYGKINNPNLDRGDFIFVPLAVRRRQIVEEEKVQEEKTAITEELKTKRRDVEERLRKETAEKKALEEELKKLKDEMKRPLPKEGEKSLAYIPKTARAKVCNELRDGRGPFLIDDFEDKDLWSGRFYDRWKYWSMGPANIAVTIDPTQGANGTPSSMKLEYKMGPRSTFVVQIGGGLQERITEVQRDSSTAYDLSRFNKISFYLKGKKSKSFFSKPNKIFLLIYCYGERIKSRLGQMAHYYNKTNIFPDKEWKRVEIPFNDFVPSLWTEYNVENYPDKLDLHNVLRLGFLLSSFTEEDGSPGSNTVWIDEVTLE